MKTITVFLLGICMVGAGCTGGVTDFLVIIDEKTTLPSNFPSAHFTDTTAALWIKHLSASYRRISFVLEREGPKKNDALFGFDLPVELAQLDVNGRKVLVPQFQRPMLSKSGGFTLNFVPRLRAYLSEGDICFEMPVKVYFAKTKRVSYTEDPQQIFTFSSITSVLMHLTAGDTTTFCEDRRTLSAETSNMLAKTFLFRNRNNVLEISSLPHTSKLDFLGEDFGSGKYKIKIHSDIERSPITAKDIPSRK